MLARKYPKGISCQPTIDSRKPSVKIPILTSKLDFYWSFYCPTVKLHKYAIPNKFYEHLQLDLPIIASQIIPQSEFIKSNNTGIILNDLLPQHHDLLINQLFDFKFESGHIYSLWKKKYQGYYNNIFIR